MIHLILPLQALLDCWTIICSSLYWDVGLPRWHSLRSRSTWHMASIFPSSAMLPATWVGEISMSVNFKLARVSTCPKEALFRLPRQFLNALAWIAILTQKRKKSQGPKLEAELKKGAGNDSIDGSLEYKISLKLTKSIIKPRWKPWITLIVHLEYTLLLVVLPLAWMLVCLNPGSGYQNRPWQTPVTC